mmetsp:Transcript_90711/g.241014  ORF Transcript_90711/g.241014 Transcript_90711/m.241014 type:complete len:234 (+) Transcript_90711:151-852(+)
MTRARVQTYCSTAACRPRSTSSTAVPLALDSLATPLAWDALERSIASRTALLRFERSVFSRPRPNFLCHFFSEPRRVSEVSSSLTSLRSSTLGAEPLEAFHRRHLVASATVSAKAPTQSWSCSFVFATLSLRHCAQMKPPAEPSSSAAMASPVERIHGDGSSGTPSADLVQPLPLRLKPSMAMTASLWYSSRNSSSVSLVGFCACLWTTTRGGCSCPGRQSAKKSSMLIHLSQ